MQPKHPVEPVTDFWQRLCLENALIVLAYWGVAHLTFHLFSSLGILPMPVWPPAALAIVVSFYRGWVIAPGIALGTIVANLFSLGSPFGYACSIALMNTLGPLFGAAIIQRRVTSCLLIRNLADLLICFVAVYFLPPMLAATGGIGFKYLLGMMPASELLVAWLKWTTAHSLGSLLFATPIFAWMAFREPQKMDACASENDPVSPPIQMLVIVACMLLAASLWFADSLFEFLWINGASGIFLSKLVPHHNVHELLTRIMYCSAFIFAGIAVGGALQRLIRQQIETATVAENLRITLNSIGDAVITTDRDGCITRMNPCAQKITGWTIDDAYRKPLTEVFVIVNAHTRQPAFNPVDHVLATGQIVGLANDTLLIARDGSEQQIADSAAPIQGSDTTITGVILVFRDVSEEYRIRHAMERTNALLTAVVEQAHVPIALATAEQGRILMVNQACLTFLGIRQEAALEVNADDFARLWSNCTADGILLPPERNPLVQALRGIATQGLELTIEGANGMQRQAIAEGVPIRNQEGLVTAGLLFLVDTTERRAMEEERRKLQRLESIGTLAGGIAHDFNNILMGIFGGIELAKLTLPPEHESYRYIETAHQALDRATHLTNQLLTFAKGGDPLLESVCLPPLIRDAVHFNLTGSSIKTQLDLAPDLWSIRADKGQISQVLANLIINAKQAMPNGGILCITAENVAGTHEISGISQHDDWVRLVIRDEGIGMTEKVREKIFDPYFSTKQSGSGLGLAIVNSIITKHRGRIQVDSMPDVGTTFTLYLPADKDSSLAGASWDFAGSLPHNRGRILIIDDEGMIREIAAEMLAVLGFEVEEATNGEEALEKYAAAAEAGQPFACVIMDLTIPGGIGGKETIAALHARYPDAVAIVASGYSTDPVMADFARYGFKGRLIKPFQVNQLRQELLRVVAP